VILSESVLVITWLAHDDDDDGDDCEILYSAPAAVFCDSVTLIFSFYSTRRLGRFALYGVRDFW